MSRENQNRFAKDLNKCGIIEGELVLATCSGGPDSMLLLHALKSIGASFEVAHVNFKLRGDESDGDEGFVRQWCLKNIVAFHCETMDASRKSVFQYDASTRGGCKNDRRERPKYSRCLSVLIGLLLKM